MSRDKQARKRHYQWHKSIILFITLVSVLAVVAGSTVAVLITKTSPVYNTFHHSYVTCAVREGEFVNGTSLEKANVRIQNTGDIESYIRGAVVVTWKDAQGNVYAKAPVKGEDYKIELGTTGWFDGNDGFYYYKHPVAPDQETETLIHRCYPITSGLDGYSLSVEILASAIQSKPANAVKDSWDVTVNDDGTISK